jgi:hypothetical protein
MTDTIETPREWTRLEALEHAAEIFLAVVSDGDVPELLDYLQSIFEEALETPK